MKRILALLVALGGLLAAALAWADHPVELGSTPTRPPASCPNNCQAIGQVTGFQVQQGAFKNPFLRNHPGNVVAFSITLGRPKQTDVDFFNKLFGSPAEAQIAVLKPLRRQRMKVVALSPAFNLTPYFGSTPTFALPRPLRVLPGYVVALNVPTWAPAFAVNLANDEVWRSSRDPQHCNDVQQQASMNRLRQVAFYTCSYRTARLMYTVTFIPDPRVTNPPPKKRSRR